MKIAIDCRMLGSGGIGSYLQALLPFFTEQHECLCICHESQLSLVQSFNPNSIEVCNIKPFSIKELCFFPLKINKKINKCDAYYSPYFNVPSGIKIPVYTTIHDVIFLDLPELVSKIGFIARKLMYQYGILKSEQIFTVSNFSKERILYHFSTKKNIVITYNAVPSWLRLENYHKKTLIENEEEQYLLFVGNIKKHKGLSTLLEAYRILIDKGFKRKLYIVGNAENFRTGDKQVFDYISSFPNDKIVFTGKISDCEIQKLYYNASLLVQPSFYEGFGMPPLEALYNGTRVVLSDIPVFKEIYNDYPVCFFKTGDSQDLANKIEKVLSFGQELPSLPDKYTFKKTFEIIEKILERDYENSYCS